MSTVTAHTLFGGVARYSASAGTTSLAGCPKPGIVSLPSARNSGKKTPRSLQCYYLDPKSIDHPSNIPPFALVHPVPTTTAGWMIKEEDTNVKLTFFFSKPTEAEKDDFQVVVQGDVLVIRKPPPGKQAGHEGISFNVQLLLPQLYNKEKIVAEIKHRELVVNIPRFQSLPDNSAKADVHTKVPVQ